MTPAIAHEKPYKGAESYQVEDGELFFGRDADSDELVCQILASRFTLLHAPSGAGKTSLLNARVIPQLEQKGWLAVRARLHDDPERSVRQTTLDWLLAAPSAELAAVRRAQRALGDGITLATMFERYDRLAPRDPLKRDLVAQLPAASAGGSGRVQTWFARLLRGTVGLEEFAGHLSAIDAAAPAPGEQTTLETLGEIFASPEFERAYGAIAGLVDRDFPYLSDFFVNLVEIYGRRRSRFGVVLILDQFEEIFTRFAGRRQPGAIAPSDSPRRRVRDDFFDELKRLHVREMQSLTDGSPMPLPVRIVISMRDEFIAQLDTIREFVPELPANSYHLSALRKEAAERAIREPARLFGYSYEPACFAQIVAQLARDGDFVEPAHLQIVCEKLWAESGKALVESAAGSGTLPEVRLEKFQELGGVPGMLNSFFTEFLAGLADADRLEALEMLAVLVTPSGTRNIVGEEYLVNAPLRDPARRRDLIHKLNDRIIVRIEPRLGGRFVEITHEFLIEPIQQAILKELHADPEYALFRSALRSIEHIRDLPFYVPGARLLRLEEFQVLHARRDQVKWTGWSAEIMLRSVIGLGRDAKEELATWLDRFAELGSPSCLDDALDHAARRRYLSWQELRLVNQSRGGLRLSLAQVESILASELLHATEKERDDVIYWTEELQRAAQSA
jgi:hypothetical protein